MGIKEQVAYVQGLAAGMSIDSTDEGKLFSAIIDTLDAIADEIEELNENALDIGDELDALSSDLAEVEEFLEDFDHDDEDFDFDNNFDVSGFDDDDLDDDNINRCGNCAEPSTKYAIDVTCPECGAALELDEEDIASEQVTCPSCGKATELQIDEVDVDENDADNASPSDAYGGDGS